MREEEDMLKIMHDAFTELDLELDSELVGQCTALCKRFEISPDTLASEVLSMRIGKRNGKVTMDELFDVEQHLCHRQNEDCASTAVINGNTRSATGIRIYKATVEDDDDNVLEFYGTPTTKRNVQHRTPEVAKRLIGTTGSPAVPFSPDSFSPSIYQSASSVKYAQRTNSGEVVCRHGPEKPCLPPSSKFTGAINLCDPVYGEEPLLGPHPHMFQKLIDCAGTGEELIEEYGKIMLDKAGVKDTVTSVTSVAPEPVVVVGCIVASDGGKLTPANVHLQGSRDTSNGTTVALDLSKLQEASLFPGQLVILEGTNPTGRLFIPTKIISNIIPEFPPKETVLSNEESLNILVAAGQFVPSDSTSFTPVADLINILEKERPHVAILLGPFIDCNHKALTDGDLNHTSEIICDNHLKHILAATEKIGTQIVYITSSRDLHNLPVYPTPPWATKKLHPRLHLMPDPSLLNIGGVVIGATTTDILLHMGKQEYSTPRHSMPRLARLSQHLLHQASFYPLYPSTEGISIDSEMCADFARMPFRPHILIVPSDLRSFIKVVEDSIVINPERVTKGMVSGSYARLQVNAPLPDEKSVVNSTFAEVVRF